MATSSSSSKDTNGDGKADKCTTFLDDLNGPTGFSFYNDGVLVMQAPDLWFVRDTNGDGKADWKERLLMGLDSADSHHTTNAINPDPAGAIYPSDGVFHRTQLETATGPIRHQDAIIWRFEPRTGKAEKYAPYGLVNPHGKVWDYWGNDIPDKRHQQRQFLWPGDQRPPGQWRSPGDEGILAAAIAPMSRHMDDLQPALSGRLAGELPQPERDQRPVHLPCEGRD
jgi:hypothetical protein